ncbi:hypothetical protein BOX15_Mlig028365g1 [Macrostomum lignano]|uniref:Uncharacterized protein n=1 Tax=Macrostomum lignano TaxID=282301 RepID=A0A267EA02_9PLAT|nr:hypothetical protein BOX15_Mlig028365g1 [Macrostomum lignano]
MGLLRRRTNVLLGHYSLHPFQHRHQHLHQQVHQHQQLQHLLFSASNATLSRYPYERAALPRLSDGQRRLRFLNFALIILAFSTAYAVFILRCIQFGQVLTTGQNSAVELACIAGLASSGFLHAVCLLVQLMDNRRQRLPGGCCWGLCGCCARPGGDDLASNRSPGSETASSGAASLMTAA